MLRLFLQFEIGRIGKYFRTRKVPKLITTSLFLLVFLFIGVGIYFFFISGFRYINVEAPEDIRSALTLFLYELFLIILGGIIVFSAMVSGLFNLFRGGYNNWLISSPRYVLFPKIVFMRGLLSSLLPSIIVFLPAVLALIKVYHLHIWGLLLILISVFLVLVIITSLTLLTIILVGYAYYQLSRVIKRLHFTFGRLITILLFIITSIVAIVWRTVKEIDLVAVFKADEASDVLSVTNIGNHFSLLPTHPLAMEIVSWQTRDTERALLYFLVLFALAFVSFVVYGYVASLFYPLWQKFQEGTSKKDSMFARTSMQTKPYRFTGGNVVALFKKEALVSSRNWKGVLWFCFLFLIWLLQIGMNVIVNSHIHRYELDISHKKISFQVIQYIIAIYFMSAFTLRFVFPSFSVEKKTAWILTSAPLNFKKIFFGKYLFYSIFFVSLGVLMSFINSGVLGLSFTHAFYLMLLFITTIIFIVTVGIVLGALFPSTETDDPEAISTSMSGLSFTALALIYGAISDGVLYLTLTQGSVLYLLIFVVFTLLTVLFLLLKTPAWVNKRAR
jgi:uncharacterized protein with PQ loop repeat